MTVWGRTRGHIVRMGNQLGTVIVQRYNKSVGSFNTVNLSVAAGATEIEELSEIEESTSIRGTGVSAHLDIRAVSGPD